MTGVAQLTERLPIKQKAKGSIPSQGTCLVGHPVPSWGKYKKQLIDVALLLFLPPFPSLKINT